MKHLSNEIASFHPSPDDGYACLYFGHAFSSIPPAFSISSSLAGDPSPSLLITFSHLSPSLSLSLSSHFSSSSFSLELNRGVASHLRRKKEGREEESSRGHLPPLLSSLSFPLACRVAGGARLSCGRRRCRQGGGREQGTGKMIKASSSSSSPVGWLLSLSLALSPSASV